MGWKYVMMEATFGETKVLFPVIFPDKMIHLEVATVMKLCGPLDGNAPRVVSAGKIEHLVVDGIGGKSTTLGIGSRNEDWGIIDGYSYAHGIVT